MPCPNKNLPEWNNLVTALGSEAKAQAAFYLNNYDIPTTAVAESLLAHAINGEKANPFADVKSKQLKLDRVAEQIETMEGVLATARTEATKAVYAKILTNLRTYQAVVENEEATVSVTNLTGGGEVEGMEKFRDFASFGNMIHFIVENLQKEVLGSKASITSKFNRAKLIELTNAFNQTQKRPFTVHKLIEDGDIVNEDDLFNMTNDILSVLQGYISRGYTVLPEISVLSKDRFGRNIIGRIDIMAVNPQGEIAVMDIKTKKMSSKATSDKLKKAYPVKASKLTDSEFIGWSRSSYDNWDIQLNIYERMLQQIGIDVTEKQVLGLLYYGNYDAATGEEFDEFGQSMFDYDYYRVNTTTVSEHNQTSDAELMRYNMIRDKVAKVLPVEGKEKLASEDNREQFIFNMSKAEADVLTENIRNITKNELIAAKGKLNDVRAKDGGKDLIEFWEERIKTLNEITSALDNAAWESAYKVGFILKALEQNMQQLVNTAREVTQIGDMKQRAEELDRLLRTANGYNNFVFQLKSLLIESNVPQNAKAITVLNNIENNVREVVSRNNQLGLRFTIDILKDSLSPSQLVKLDERRRQVLTDEIAYLEKKRDGLKANGEESGLWYRITKPINNLFNSATGEKAIPKTEIERLDFQIEKLKLELEGVKLDDASLTKYIEGILDPSSPIYIGEGTSFFTQYIASASSADWVLSSYANQLKVSLQQGQQEYVNFVERENIQGELNTYKAGETNVQKLNDPISEIRNEIVYEEDGTESKIQRRSFVNPLSEDYHQVFDRHYQKLKVLYRQIGEEADPVKKKALKQERALLTQKHLEWRRANTSMKLKDEVYEIDTFLPAAYKEERDALYEEKNLLESSAGYNNQEYLDETTQYRIAEIDVELNKLKKRYADMDGNYAKYIELREKYYEFTVNQKKYDALLAQKKIELTDTNGIIDLEKLQVWKDANTVKAPKQEYFDQVGAIWDSVFNILGKTDPNIDELRQKQKEILSQYRRRGLVDSRHITQSDIDTLESIDDMIKQIKAGNKTELDFADRIELNELFAELQSIQKSVENPIYQKEFNLRTDALENAWAQFQSADPAEKEAKMEQYVLHEMEFKTWYDNNHMNEYESKFISAEGMNPIPKAFNLINVPVDPGMLEERPGFQYSTSKLKEEAYNPDYQEDALGYPMPKGLVREGAVVNGSSQWMNPKYAQIRSNPRTAAFYHSFVGRFLDMQSKTTGRTLGYNFPGYEEKSVDDVMNKGVVGGVKNRMKMFKEKNLTIHGEYDFTVNNYNSTLEDRIQFKHNRPLSIDQQSTNGIGSVILWYEQAFVNQKAAEVKPMAKAVVTYMESLYEEVSRSSIVDKDKRLNDLKRVIDSMKFEYGKYIKGETKLDQGSFGRMADLALRGIGFTRLALDIPNQVGNLLSGNVQAFLGSSSSGQYSAKDYIYAKMMVEGKDGLVGSLLKDYGKVGGKSHMTKMLLYMNPTQGSLDHYYDRTRSTSQRLAQGLADGNPMFFIQDKGELEISSTIWLAICNNHKVKVVASRNQDGSVKDYKLDANGDIETVNAFEAYKSNEKGEIVIREDVEWTKQDEAGLMKTVWSEIRRTQGKYATWDQSKIEEGLTGRFLLYYRKYLEPSIRNRFGRREENKEAAEIAYGFYRGFAKALKIYGPKKLVMSMLGGKDTGVSDFYNRKSVMAMREMLVAVGLYILGGMIKNLYDDLKDDEDTAGRTVLLNMMAVYMKVDMETRSLVPLPVVGGATNYLENLGSFTNANRDFIQVANALDHGIFLGLSQFSDAEFVQRHAFYQKDTGLFEEGDAKIKKDIMGMTGYMNMYELFNPETRVENTLRRR